MAGKQKGRTMAQVRYDRRHPSWSARVDLETHKRLEELARQRSVGRAELLRILAGALPDLSPDEAQKRRVEEAEVDARVWEVVIFLYNAVISGNAGAVQVLAEFLEDATHAQGRNKDGTPDPPRFSGTRLVREYRDIGYNVDEMLDTLDMYQDEEGGLSRNK